MRRCVYIIILAFVVLGIAAIVFCIFIENTLSIDTIRFLVCSSAGDQSVSITHKGEDTFYLFLPAYATGENTRLSIPSGRIYIDGNSYYNGDTLVDIDFDLEHIISIPDEKAGATHKVSFMHADTVPAMHIKTVTGDYLNCVDKEHKETCQVALIRADGTVEYNRKNNMIRGHGNSTWGLNKKSYNLYLETESNLMELGKAKEWVLLSNAYDASNIRNKLVYDYAESIGLDFSPHCDWIDLYVDGTYRGLYLLCEKNIKGKDQINITSEGCILEMTLRSRMKGDSNEIVTRLGVPLFVKYPTTGETDDCLLNLQKRLDGFETLIENKNTTLDELENQIDIRSWVMRYLIDEIVVNRDASAISQYFYTIDDYTTGKLYSGPVWDYDLTMRPLLDVYEPEKLLCGVRSWSKYLYINEEFYNEIIDTYRNKVRDSFLSVLETKPIRYLEMMGKSLNMNSILWEIRECSSDIESLIEFEHSRIKFLDSLWLTDRKYSFIRLVTTDIIVTDICFDNELYIPRVINREDFVGWYFDTEFTRPCNEPFIPEGETTLYAKFEGTKHTDPEDSRFLDLIKDSDELMYPIILIAVFSVLLAAIVLVDLLRNRRNRH